MKKLIVLAAQKLFPVIKKFVPAVFKKLVSWIGLKPLLIIGAVVAVAVLLYLGFGGGFGGGIGEGKGDGNTQLEEMSQEEIQEEQTNQNVDAYEGAILAITVVGNDYFYQNERMELEALISQIQQVDGAFVVEIKDDNASLKAYNALIDRLEDSYIRYIEIDNSETQ